MSKEPVTFGTRELGGALTAYAREIAARINRAGLADADISEALDGVARIATLLEANPDVRLRVPPEPGAGS